MTKNKSLSRKTRKIVRTPATRFGHLEKRMRKRPQKGPPPVKP